MPELTCSGERPRDAPANVCYLPAIWCEARPEVDELSAVPYHFVTPINMFLLFLSCSYFGSFDVTFLAACHSFWRPLVFSPSYMLLQCHAFVLFIARPAAHPASWHAVRVWEKSRAGLTPDSAQKSLMHSWQPSLRSRCSGCHESSPGSPSHSTRNSLRAALPKTPTIRVGSWNMLCSDFGSEINGPIRYD